MNDPDDLKLGAPWLFHPDLTHLFGSLTQDGAVARVVGGAVRDSLLGRPVKDIDIATDASPQEVIRLLESANITVKPTGLQFGTVTAILNKKPYQITTLREDIETFGRKARVAFTEDWIADARRRDFTINAIYADPGGKLYDPCCGITDIDAGIVRFIGVPEERITEDYLRILRFFRFSLLFPENNLNPEGLAACHKYANKLLTLSKERITDEFMKILGHPHCLKSLREMTPELDQILPAYGHFKTLEAFEGFQERGGCTISPFERLATLIDDPQHLVNFQFSNERLGYLKTLIEHKTEFDRNALQASLYYHGPRVTHSLLMISQALAEDLQIEDLREDLACIDDWKKPTFPLKGEDLMALGLTKGERLGQIKDQVERWWVDCAFSPTKGHCLKKAKSLLQTKD